MRRKTFESNFTKDLVGEDFARQLYDINEREIYIQK